MPDLTEQSTHQATGRAVLGSIRDQLATFLDRTVGYSKVNSLTLLGTVVDEPQRLRALADDMETAIRLLRRWQQ